MLRFYWQTILGFTGMTGLLVALFAYLFWGRSEIILEKSEIGEDKRASFQQERLFMTKDLLYTSAEGERMQTRVRGKRATLVLEQAAGKYLLREYMSGIKGFLQEKLYYEETLQPIQDLVYFEAETGEYERGTVIAEGVKVFKLILPGHLYSENFKSSKRLMEACTDQIHFSLTEGKVRFSAEGFHAHFQGRKKI